MKFLLAASLLLAGFVTAKQLGPKESQVDQFLRNNQHLNTQAQLVSFKQNGQFYTATYKNGPANIKYRVRSNNDDLKVVGIEETISFSNQFSFNPDENSQQPSSMPAQNFGPLPLIMPGFSISQETNQVQMRNVFDVVQEQIANMEKKMEEDRKNFQKVMKDKKKQMKHRFKRHFNRYGQQMPLIGGGDHDFKWIEENTQVQQTPLLRGRGQHDFKWKQPQQLIGGGDHDYNWQATPLIGGGDHDNWSQQTQTDFPLIGGGDHDKWRQNIEKQNNLIGGGDHDKWRKHQKKWKKEGRHHANAMWRNQQFSVDQITPFLNAKLPSDIIEKSEVVSVKNNGFIKGQGFNLLIQVKTAKKQNYQITAFYKPRKQSFLIDKIQKLNANSQTTMNVPVELDTVIKAQQVLKPIQTMVPVNFIPTTQNSPLLGGKGDPDSDPEFMKRPIQISSSQNNHIPIEPKQKQQELIHVPILSDKKDQVNSEKPKVEETNLKVVQPIKNEAPKQSANQVSNIPEQKDFSEKSNVIDSIFESIIDLANNLKSGQQLKDIDEDKKPQEDKKLELLIKRI